MGLLDSLFNKKQAKASVPARPLNVRVNLLFYGSGGEIIRPPPSEYRLTFWVDTTGFVMCQITVTKLRPQPRRRYKLVACYHRPDGSLMREFRRTVVLSSRDTREVITVGMGWSEPGHWPLGEYTVYVHLDGVYAGKDVFLIKVYTPPPPRVDRYSMILASLEGRPPTSPDHPTKMLQQPSVQFYASETGRFQTGSRWYTIRFPQQATRWVICELTVRNELYPPQDRTYNIQAQCYTAEGKQLWTVRRNWPITEQEKEPSQSWALQAEQWTVGIYRIEILIDGEEFAWGVFAIK